MKKLILPFCAIIVSCGSDDTNSYLSDTERNLRGKWQLESILRNGSPYSLEQCMGQNTAEFKNTGAYLQLDYGVPQDGGSCVIDSLTAGNYQVENDSIFFTINGASDTLYKAAILEVTATTLRLNSRMYRTTDEDEGSDEITFSKAN